VLALHGYVDPARYTTLTYTTGYADALARAGYLVIHPNFRNWPPSDSGPEDYRVGQAVDVLHFLGLVRTMGGRNQVRLPRPTRNASASGATVWAAASAQRVIAVSDDVDAAVLYGSMSGDEALNHERILFFTNGAQRPVAMKPPPDEALQRISPINYLDRVTAAVSIHHGQPGRSGACSPGRRTCAAACRRSTRPVECFIYQGQPHTFVGEGDQLFVQRVREFFDRTLRGGVGVIG
jgi:uncharacterized protein